MSFSSNQTSVRYSFYSVPPFPTWYIRWPQRTRLGDSIVLVLNRCHVVLHVIASSRCLPKASPEPRDRKHKENCDEYQLYSQVEIIVKTNEEVEASATEYGFVLVANFGSENAMETVRNETMEVRWAGQGEGCKAELTGLEPASSDEDEDEVKTKDRNTGVVERIVRWERFLPQRCLRVLLVEVDDSTRQVVSALLRNCSYEEDKLLTDNSQVTLCKIPDRLNNRTQCKGHFALPDKLQRLNRIQCETAKISPIGSVLIDLTVGSVLIHIVKCASLALGQPSSSSDADSRQQSVLSNLNLKLSICCLWNSPVTAVGDGLQAWKLLEDPSNHFDLVLTEVVMPSLSGIGLLCKIMSHETCKNIPVIMMSSHDSMGIVFKCLSKGAVDFLVKPVRKNELKNLWQHVWRRCHSVCLFLPFPFRNHS
eukprot:Gb_04978 [translate_table: standard]